MREGRDDRSSSEAASIKMSLQPRYEQFKNSLTLIVRIVGVNID